MTTTLVGNDNVPNFVQGSVTTTDETITLKRPIGAGGFALQITGTWTGTITFEATVDGTTWVTFFMTPSNSATDAGTATANGAWAKQNNGYRKLRARFSTASSGTPVITIAGLRFT